MWEAGGISIHKAIEFADLLGAGKKAGAKRNSKILKGAQYKKYINRDEVSGTYWGCEAGNGRYRSVI